MADTYEADRPAVTAAEAVCDLFARLPAPGTDVVWLADQLLGIVQYLGSVVLEVGREAAGGRALLCHSPPAPSYLTLSGRGPVYLFRPLLARLAILGADETGGDPQLYGGQYTLARSSRTGPVRLEVAFTNTPGHQQVAITRVPAGVAPRPNPAPDAGAANAATQPSA